MKRLSLIIASSFFLSFSCHSQNDPWMIDQVTYEVCSQLEDYDELAQITNEQLKEIFCGTINKYQHKWDKQLQDFPNSQDENVRYSYYCQIIEHKLSLDCEKFRLADPIIDKTVKDNEMLRKLYLQVKEFVITAENSADIGLLPAYFNPLINQVKLKEDLGKLVAELRIYKKNSSVNITISPEELKFLINFYNYKNGNDNLMMIINFNDDSDMLIDHWTIKTKEELALERVDLDGDELDMDFEDIIAPPPVLNEYSIKRKDNDR